MNKEKKVTPEPMSASEVTDWENFEGCQVRINNTRLPLCPRPTNPARRKNPMCLTEYTVSVIGETTPRIVTRDLRWAVVCTMELISHGEHARITKNR